MVTRNTNTAISGTAGLNASNIPSANVSLNISRSNQLTVQYAVNTWSVSSHWVTSYNDVMPRPKAEKKSINPKMRTDSSGESNIDNKSSHNGNRASSSKGKLWYQWFWVGNQEEAEILTPDLKHTVKRHIFVKRIIPTNELPVNKEILGDNLESDLLENVLNFSFRVQVRVKRRYGRMHRLLLLSSNRVKGSTLKPEHREMFNIRVPRDFVDGKDIPQNDTADITAILEQVKKDHDGKWDALHGRDLPKIHPFEHQAVNAKGFRVVVRSTEKTIHLNCYPSDTIGKIRQMISGELNVELNRQRLMITSGVKRGSVLDNDNETLQCKGIVSKTELTITSQPSMESK